MFNIYESAHMRECNFPSFKETRSAYTGILLIQVSNLAGLTGYIFKRLSHD